MQIKSLHIILGVLSVLSVAGCTPAWYDMMENGRVISCDSLQGQEREECLTQAKKPYEEYKQEREQAVK